MITKIVDSALISKRPGEGSNLRPLTDCQRRLVDQWAGLPATIAREFTDEPGLLSDLVSAGHVGLCNAASAFDPRRGVKFQTFAGLCIRRVCLRELTGHIKRSQQEVKSAADEDNTVGYGIHLGVVEFPEDSLLVAIELQGRLSVLTQELRDVLHEVCVLGCSFAEAGKRLGVSNVTAWTRYNRAIKILRAEAEKEGVE